MLPYIAGVDPSEAQWREVLALVQRRRLLPFFDSAYQGFASVGPAARVDYLPIVYPQPLLYSPTMYRLNVCKEKEKKKKK